jgi:hypothetical protein
MGEWYGSMSSLSSSFRFSTSKMANTPVFSAESSFLGMSWGFLSIVIGPPQWDWLWGWLVKHFVVLGKPVDEVLVGIDDKGTSVLLHGIGW